MSMNLENFRIVAEEAAKMAGSFLRLMSFNELRIFLKGENDVVTTFDLESERLIKNHIKMHFPDHIIQAEESETEMETLPDNVIWFVDPLDGSKAFLRGNFAFVCMSIAAWDKSGLLAGVVFNPFTNMLYSASRNGSVWLNGSPLPPPSDCSIEKARIIVDFSNRQAESLKQEMALADLKGRIGRAYRLGGGISQHLMLIAQGTIHGGIFWGIGRKGQFWDIAAAALMLERLGLNFTNLEGKAIHPTDTIFDQIIVAPPGLHRQLLDWVAELKPLSEKRLL